MNLTIRVLVFSATWVALLTHFYCGLVFGQDPVQEGKNQFQRRNFQWYDSETESVIDIPRQKARRAKTLDRADVPRAGVKKSTTTAPAAPTNVNPGWATALSTTAWILIGIVFALIIGLLVWVFFKMESEAHTARNEVVEEEVDIRERIKNLPFQMDEPQKGDFRKLAVDAAARGEYGRATVLLFSHVLLLLDKKQLIRLRKGKTNRQYLMEIKEHSEISDYYRSVMIPFEDTFFGEHQIQKNVFESCLSELDKFQTHVESASQREVAAI